MYKVATDKLAKELDLINVLKTIRRSKLLLSSVLDSKQKMLMLYQKRDVIGDG